MAALATIDDAVYGKLLVKTLPRVIKTVQENERIVGELEWLDSLGRPLTPEEENLAELMTVLVQQFEATKYPLGEVEPLQALQSLMEDRGLRQSDLVSVFGSRSVASSVLAGKRSISKAHARKLAEYFRVPVSLFV